jgi:outer membrane biosynthesis protein TonB
MLWLQLPVLHKKYAYLGQLFLLSLGMHCLLLSALFFSFKTTGKHSLTIHSKVLTEAPIVFMPLQKVVHTSQAPTIQTKKVACAPKPQPQKKNPAKPIVVPQKLMGPKKVVQAQPKPLSSPKKVEEKKPIIEKKVEKKPEPKPEVVKQEAVPQPEVKQEVVAQAEVVHVGRDELMEITLQRHVIEQVKKVWQPPAGIAQDVCCSVYFSVDDEGKATNVVMEQSSGSVLYDIGARNAILRAQFPVQARKKEFTVAFKP